jgi:hypothetical protein
MRATVFFLLAAVACAGARADAPADQIERAQLLRDLLETQPPAQADSDASILPGANIEMDSARAREASRRQQLGESQWRSLLGSQQMHHAVPPAQPLPETQWRSQAFERERRSENLSNDILRQSREYLNRH